jgi:hypothetical protein
VAVLDGGFYLRMKAYLVYQASGLDLKDVDPIKKL